MRLDTNEKKALKHALRDFDGEIYLFGSRTSNVRKGGDIDILLMPRRKQNSLKLSYEYNKR